MLTQNEFYQFARLDKANLRKFVQTRIYTLGHSYGVEWLMRFRRHSQMALARYAKTHKYDDIQNNIVRNNELISRWCVGWFAPWARNELIKHNPKLVKQPAKLKYLVIDACERFIKERSY